MAASIDDIFGNHAQALQWRARRSEVLATNLANADTPHYKARDIDFQAALKEAQGNGIGFQTTHPDHLGGNGTGSRAEELGNVMRYRVPSQPSLDGNTVDTQQEKAAFTENAVSYRATLSFLNGRISGIIRALKGE